MSRFCCLFPWVLANSWSWHNRNRVSRWSMPSGNEVSVSRRVLFTLTQTSARTHLWKTREWFWQEIFLTNRQPERHTHDDDEACMSRHYLRVFPIFSPFSLVVVLLLTRARNFALCRLLFTSVTLSSRSTANIEESCSTTTTRRRKRERQTWKTVSSSNRVLFAIVLLVSVDCCCCHNS